MRCCCVSAKCRLRCCSFLGSPFGSGGFWAFVIGRKTSGMPLWAVLVVICVHGQVSSAFSATWKPARPPETKLTSAMLKRQLLSRPKAKDKRVEGWSHWQSGKDAGWARWQSQAQTTQTLCETLSETSDGRDAATTPRDQAKQGIEPAEPDWAFGRPAARTFCAITPCHWWMTFAELVCQIRQYFSFGPTGLCMGPGQPPLREGRPQKAI